MKKSVLAVAGKSAAVQHALDARILQSRTSQLLASGLLDREFYEAQVGQTFESDEAALHHYLEIGRFELRSITTLFNEDWYRAQTGAPESDRFLSMFFGIEPLASTSPVFDAVRYSRECEILGIPAPGNTRAALELFVRFAENNTELPSHPLASGTLHFGRMRRAAIDLARKQQIRNQPHDVPELFEWNEDASRDATQTLRNAPRGGEPLVSVVIAIRDGRDALPSAIQSVRDQRWENWELLLVDDASVDGSDEAIAHAATLDPRVQSFVNDGNGVASARNQALHAAAGEFVLFLDVDHVLEPDALLVLTNFLLRNDAPAVRSAVRVLHPFDTRYQFITGDRESLRHTELSPSLSATLFRKQALERIDGFDESMKAAVDFDLFLRLLKKVEVPSLEYLAATTAHFAGPRTLAVREPAGWRRRALTKDLIRWDDQRASLDSRTDDAVSIVIPVYLDWEMTAAAVRSIVASSNHYPLEIVIVDNGSSPLTQAILQQCVLGVANLKFVPMQANTHFALGCNIGFSKTTKDRVIFLNNDTAVQPGWLTPLVNALRDPSVLGAQPRLVYDDGRIQAAGTVFNGSRVAPWHFLAGHDPVDADAADQSDFFAITAACMALRAADIAAVEGFDPIYTNGFEDIDLCLRLGARSEGKFKVVHEATVVHFESKTPGRFKASDENRRTFFDRWRGNIPSDASEKYAAADSEITAFRNGRTFVTAVLRDVAPITKRIHPRVEHGPWAGRPQLRFSIKIAAPAGAEGDEWGDTVFADDLARSMRAQGQHVVVDRRDYHSGPTESLEDVAIVLRGVALTAPNPSALNILWVISHPEMVSETELKTFDTVFAASIPWSRGATNRSGREVLPLLQATDPNRFNPMLDREAPRNPRVSFVGNTRGIARKMLMDALAADVPVSIYGSGWQEFIHPELVRATWLGPDEVANIYRSSDYLLNDHWTDMANEGFISNRVFDVVASGTTIVSDEVEGMREIFGEAVRFANSPEEIAEIVRGGNKVPRHRLIEIAQRIGQEHSFDARATTLIQSAYDSLEAGRIPSLASSDSAPRNDSAWVE
ncbi:glycosyltransferase [Humidisolicoccus flavus]|uniref:glycosyltransferase n=1 Tax=Humidisolicoccus flavus TaxID=3111414 RepID=UPI003253EABB